MYDKKVVVLSQLNGTFAKANKKVCAMVKLIFDGQKANGNLFVCNAQSPFMGSWLLVMKIDDTFFKVELENLEQSFLLPCGQGSKISCLLAFVAEANYPVASGSCGRFDNQLVTLLDEIVEANADGNLVTFCQDSPTQYAQFVASAGNFYQAEPKVFDVEQFKKQAEKRMDAVKDYSTAFEKYYSAKTGDNYYQSVKEELTQLFVTFPPFTPLMERFSDSFFVKVDCNADKYFALGVLTKDGDPKYICYAVPGEKNFSDKDFVYLQEGGQGFWLLYQDADTGQITVRLDCD